MSAEAASGAELMRRLDALGAISDEPGRLTRLYLSPAHRRAAELVRRWMVAAGMTVRTDALANLIGRYEGASPAAPALLIGSHIDTVRDAGKYDGALGVVAGIAAVDALNRRDERLPFAVEVIAFGDEEGVRFPTTLSGSRAVAGTFDPAALEATDEEGVRLAAALAEFGGDPAAVESAARQPDTVVGYLEVHIEQGPVLEREGLPVGVVTAIAAQRRAQVEVAGEAGHAGTVPMRLRRDALAAAAEMILAVEERARNSADLVATVGRIAAAPGAVNVIAGAARFSLDVRAPTDSACAEAAAEIESALAEIAPRRGVGLSIVHGHAAAATPCDPALAAALAGAVADLGLPVRQLASGAGHDAMAMAALCPVGMLFVRCRGGVSHHPAEAIAAADAETAVRVLVQTLHRLAQAP